MAAILATTELTRREIPYLLQPTKATPRFSLLNVWRDVTSTFGNRDFVILFTAALVFAAITGTTGTLGIYMATYFWGLTSAQLQWFTLTIVGAVAWPSYLAGVRRTDVSTRSRCCWSRSRSWWSTAWV